MKNDEAKERIVADILALPPAARQAETLAANFASKVNGRCRARATLINLCHEVKGLRRLLRAYRARMALTPGDAPWPTAEIILRL